MVIRIHKSSNINVVSVKDLKLAIERCGIC